MTEGKPARMCLVIYSSLLACTGLYSTSVTEGQKKVGIVSYCSYINCIIYHSFEFFHAYVIF